MRYQKFPPLSEETKIKIIEKWKFSKDNRTSVIALEFNINHTQVSKVIDDYLSKKSALM